MGGAPGEGKGGWGAAQKNGGEKKENCGPRAVTAATNRRINMRKIVFATLGILALASAVAAQSNAVQTAADTLGAARIKTLQFTGSGQNFSVGQNYTPAEPWPPVTVKTYTASINYDTGSMRV